MKRKHKSDKRYQFIDRHVRAFLKDRTLTSISVGNRCGTIQLSRISETSNIVNAVGFSVGNNDI
jgi:hypothetical protein